MKNRFLALIAALLCICMLFVSCSEDIELCTTHADANDDGLCDNCEATFVKQAPCTTPADANGDGVCDSCGKHAYVIPEALPTPELPVEMVVNTVPADAAMTDYFDFTYDNGKIIITTAEMVIEDSTTIVDSNSDVALFKVTTVEEIEVPATDDEESEEVKTINEYTVTYVLISSENFETPLWTATSKYSSEQYSSLHYEGTAYEVYFYDDCYVIAVVNMVDGEIPEGEDEPRKVFEHTFTYYTNSGEKITEQEYTQDYDSIYNYNVPEKVNCKNDKVGVVIDGMIYVIDEETKAVEHVARKDLFIDRPEFDYVIGDYGYLYNSGYDYNYDYYEEIQVYNLKNDALWIDCVYVLDVDDYEDAEAFILQNGNILVQAEETVAYSDINYDVEDYGDKYNIEYYIVNPVTAEVKEVEFGYYIDELELVEDPEEEGFTDKVINIATVSTIKNKGIADDERYFIVDNELNILFEVNPFVVGQQYFDYTVVGENLLLVELVVGDAKIKAVVNTKGEIVNYLPENVILGNGYVTIRGESGIFYNYDMSLIIDLEEEEFVIRNSGNGSYLLYKNKTVIDVIEGEGDEEDQEVESVIKEYYFFNPTVNEAPVLIADERTEGYYSHSLFSGVGYVVVTKEIVEIEPEEEGGEPTTEIVYTYTLYNLNGDKVADFDTVPVFATEDDGVVMVMVGDSIYYLS